MADIRSVDWSTSTRRSDDPARPRDHLDGVPDATVYTFNLNPAAVWSDGEPVTADDVEYTIAWTPRTRPPGSSRSRSTCGWRSSGGAASGTKNIPEGIKKIDALHGRAHLERPMPRSCGGSPARSTTSSEAHPRRHHRRRGADLPVLPRHGRGKTIGSGPYDITESISAGGATFTAKKDYWKGKDSQINKLVYKIQESNVRWRSLRPVSLT